MSPDLPATGMSVARAGHRIFSANGEQVLELIWTPLSAPRPPVQRPFCTVLIISLASLESVALQVPLGGKKTIDISDLEPDDGRRVATVGLRDDPLGGLILSGTLPLDLSDFFSGDIGPVEAPSDLPLTADEPPGTAPPTRYGPGEPWSRRKTADDDADATPTE
jgi:hypothetical protein